MVNKRKRYYRDTEAVRRRRPGCPGAAARAARRGGGFILTLALLLLPGMSVAQYNAPENRQWVFGFFAGLDFNSGTPVPFRTAVSGIPNNNGATGMASAAVCDRNGQLLFYTNGSHVWNRQHNLMHLNALHSGPINLTPVTQVTTQGTLIVPFPGDPDKYYIFSLTHPGTHATLAATMYGKLYYTVVDMQLNGGLGGIVPGQQWIYMQESLADKMVAAPGDRCNVWLLVHAIDTNSFHAYEITSAGVSSTPVTSYVGSMRTRLAPGGRNTYWTNGQMGISTDYQKLVINSTGQYSINNPDSAGFTEMFDFDRVTGQVSNPVMLDSGVLAYGLAFSAGNTKLYTTEKDPARAYDSHVYQYDLQAGTIAAIRQSKTRISTGYVAQTQLKLGPDNRIYFGNNHDMFLNTSLRGRRLGAILSPDAPGPACRYQPFAVELLDSTSMIYGLSHEVTRVRDSIFSRTEVKLCGETVLLEAVAGYDSYIWNTGAAGPALTVNAPGTYWVTGRKGCVTAVDTFVVSYAVTVDLGPDTVICRNPRPVTLRPRTDLQVSEYLWSDGSDGRTLTVRESGTYWVKIRANGCIASDTVQLQLSHLDPRLGNDTIYCDPAARDTLSVDVPSSATALWSDGSTGSSVVPDHSGTYWVQLREGICMAADTINVLFLDMAADLGPDQVFCRERPIAAELSVDVPEGATILWSDGSQTPVMIVRDTGIVWVSLDYAQCNARDTVIIRSEFCNCNVSIPSAFSPNRDGRNDIFRPVIGKDCLVSSCDMAVYNRWGELVFYTSDIAGGWDGSYKGMPAGIGTYMYRITVTVGTERHVQSFKGDVTLVR